MKLMKWKVKAGEGWAPAITNKSLFFNLSSFSSLLLGLLRPSKREREEGRAVGEGKKKINQSILNKTNFISQKEMNEVL